MGIEKIALQGQDLAAKALSQSSLSPVSKYKSLLKGLRKCTISADTFIKNANSTLDDASSTLNNTIDAIKAIESGKDELIKFASEKDVKKSLGLNTTIANEKEYLRQELIDPLFDNVNIFTRIKQCFIPNAFADGKKIAFSKSELNQIKSNLEKGKNAHVIKQKDGETITTFIKGKKTQKQGEDCFESFVKRELQDGRKETVALRYYPKSNEIRTVSSDLNGNRTLSVVLGSTDGATTKTKELHSKNN